MPSDPQPLSMVMRGIRSRDMVVHIAGRGPRIIQGEARATVGPYRELKAPAVPVPEIFFLPDR